MYKRYVLVVLGSRIYLYIRIFEVKNVINHESVCQWVFFLTAQSPLTFLTEVVHILHNDYLLCIDDNEGFRLLIWFGEKGKLKNT